MEHATGVGAELITQALVFLAATCLFVPAFRRLRLSAVMAYLLIGVAMGPDGLGRLADDWPALDVFALKEGEQTQALAELGVVFLLFVIGLEVSWERLWTLRTQVFGLGGAQLALTAAAITAISLSLGDGFKVAAVLGLAFALSSTALVLQLLRERRQMTAPLGRAAFSVLLLQDLMVVPILFVVAALSTGGMEGGGFGLGLALASALGAIAAIFFIGRLVLRPMFRWVASIDSRETFIAAACLAAIGMAAAAQSAGLSMALGAFMAGLLLAETEFRHQIETDLEPFKDLLLGLFFVTVGMQIDIAALINAPLLILLGVVSLMALKAAIIAPLARLFGLSWPRAIEMAFLLGQAGEFGFVVIAAARVGGVIPEGIADYMLLVTAVSIFLTPPAATLGAWIGSMLPKPDVEGPHEAPAMRDHVIIAGFGRVGQMLSDMLSAHDIAHVAIDADAETVSLLRSANRPIYYGDCGQLAVLRALGAERAAAIVITIDKADAVERLVGLAKNAWPNVPVYARARDAEQARLLHKAGADLASPDTLEAALQLGEAVLNGLGAPDELTARIIRERRETELNRALYGPAPNSST